MGSRPSHPELLDWLARRFRTNGWSIKQAIREIVLSRTYRLSSNHSPANAQIDPANERLWRASVRRLDAESLRDSMLLISGKLNLTPPTGSVITSFQDREFNSQVFPSDEQLTSAHRSVYLLIARYWLPDMLREFDFADPSLVTGKRTERTMASQSLFLMNSSFVTEQAKLIAAEVLSQPESDRAAAAFRKILLRKPTDAESNGLSELARNLAEPAPTSESAATAPLDNEALAAGWATACQTLLMTAEFRYLP